MCNSDRIVDASGKSASMGLTMAQHRQAPSQFKEEPGHDSVSAIFILRLPIPRRKRKGETEKFLLWIFSIQSPFSLHSLVRFPRTDVATKPSPFIQRQFPQELVSHVGRLAISTPACRFDIACCMRWSQNPKTPHPLISSSGCRVAEGRTRGQHYPSWISIVPENSHACRELGQAWIHMGRVLGLQGAVLFHQQPGFGSNATGGVPGCVVRFRSE